MATLVERLGYTADARLLIITCENLGCAHATNVGAYDVLRAGVGTSASLMVPCPWAREAAAAYRGEDVGVNLTLNAPFERYRWGPITLAPSLLDGDGGFPRTANDLWDHADTDEVRRECRAQIERAILWGFDVNHLGTQLDALNARPEFFDVYLELATEFELPLRLQSGDSEPAYGFPFRRRAAEHGVLSPDRVLRPRTAEVLEQALAEIEPGVTELVVNPAIETPELRAAYPGWNDWASQHELLVDAASIPKLLERTGVTRIGYRALRDAQTASRA
ncbi:MAG: ChbG/HpnK family deacetylase [bacterium]|nr:ChbG/HpnK family deacetylase [bacterium]MDE0668497.1 ChbG/HpnK family deacetylase [bacterium]